MKWFDALIEVVKKLGFDYRKVVPAIQESKQRMPKPTDSEEVV